MKRILMTILIVFALAVSVSGTEYLPPAAPEQVADQIPEEADTFIEGLWNVTKSAMQELNPALSEAASTCLQVIIAVLLSGIVSSFFSAKRIITLDLIGAVAVGSTLLAPSVSLIRLGSETVVSLSEYGKLLLPVMTASLAAQGGTTTATALYAATALFDSLLSSAVSSLMMPMIYLYLGLSIANAALSEPLLGKMRDFIRWGATWILKLVLYIFTGFLTITGVVSGSTDAAALKAAKITISGTVPVIGGILSDASEAVLAGAGVMKSSAGIYGLLTFAALFLTPFLRIGVQYLLLKGTGALCTSFDQGAGAKLIADFSSAMGLILAMTATQTVLLMVSTVCFMKGVG